MKMRLAEKQDLPRLKAMFELVVENMRKNDVPIWNEFYPYEEFAGDIDNKRLF